MTHETTVVEETTIIAGSPTPTEETTSQKQTAPPSAPKGPGCTETAGGNVFYEADWSSGMNGWAGSSDWKHVDSMLANDGSPGDLDRRITAPCQPPTNDYALEAQIQLIDPECVFGGGRKEFGLIARAAEHEGGGVLGGFDCDKAKIASTQYNPTLALDRETIQSEPFTPGGEWHIYRLEVQGNEIRFLVDGSLLFDKASNRNLSGSKVGMFSHGAQINVASFKIMKV